MDASRVPFKNVKEGYWTRAVEVAQQKRLILRSHREIWRFLPLFVESVHPCRLVERKAAQLPNSTGK